MESLETKTTYLGKGLYGCRVIDSATQKPIVELQVEKHFEMARVSDRRAPNDIAYLWSVAKCAIERGVNRRHCFNAVRSFMRRNTYADPRQAAVKAHPCYWDNYSRLD